MNTSEPVIHIQGLIRTYGRTEAVNDLSLTVPRGRCYGLFGRNGAGKTTTIKCLLNLLQPTAGTVRVFGRDPNREEIWVKSRLAYVPDAVAFHPWMTVRGVLEYLASFRPNWNEAMEKDLLHQFQLNPDQKAMQLSKGQRTQLALIGAVCPEPELLVLDEPTSGLDPMVRREFIRTVIGAYQSAGDGDRTILVSTHLISEFEGLIDEFTIVEQGKALLTLESDAARDRFRRIRARLTQNQSVPALPGALHVRQDGRELEVVVNGSFEPVMERIRGLSPESLTTESLSLEDVFLAALPVRGRETQVSDLRTALSHAGKP